MARFGSKPSRKGMCQGCIDSKEAENPNGKIQLYCNYHNSWCRLVAWNCIGSTTKDLFNIKLMPEEVREEYRKSLEKGEKTE